MKNKKFLFISLIILAVGFASVSTILYITGRLAVQTNQDNFDVYFSSAILDGEDKTNLFVKDKKHIVYKTNELMKAGDISELEYEVTNGSNQYDADVTISCTPTTTEYYSVTTVPNELTVEAGKVESGKIKVELLKYSTEIIEETIECELVANAVERTSTGDDIVTVGDYAISGILKDKDGNIMPKTNIIVYSETPHEVTTDRNGYFYVEGLEKGIHEIYLDNGENVKDKESVAASSECVMTLSTNNVYKVTKGKCSLDSYNAGLDLENKTIKCLYDINKSFDYEFTGTTQEFTVTEECEGTYKIELWGAQGGSKDAYIGGAGAYTSGNIQLDAGKTLYINVGGVGNVPINANSRYGGFNGGGGTHGSPNGSIYYNLAGTGGGSTDISLVKPTFVKNTNYYTEIQNFNSLKSRIMVAAAGGGATASSVDGWKSYGNGGAGGGLIGNNTFGSYFNSSRYSYPGTQTAGGAGGVYSTSHANHSYVDAKFGIGGAQGWAPWGGGGSGYYGGGGGGGFSAPGAGGSSFISGHNGCDAIKEESTETNIVHTDQPNHYSGYIFTDTIMIDGLGYNWTNVLGSYVGQPQPDGSVTVGHSGNGYARITLLELK